MRVYLEATETLPLTSLEAADFIRADITSKTDAEVEAIKSDIKDIMVGLNYQLVRHICRHDEGEPCETINEI